jgi:CheY-like chemotaxis protein
MNGGLILIVDDDDDIRANLREVLEDERYQTSSATNGQEALDLLRAAPVLPRLILLDLMMPVKDGFAFRDEQRSEARLSEIPVVVMSAAGTPDLARLHIASSAYLKKPFAIDTLLAMVQRQRR